MEKELLITSLTELIDEIILATREYNISFDISDSFKFSPTEERINEIHARYRALTSKLLALSEKTDAIAAKIASLTCISDDSMNLEDILFFSKRLDAYSTWRSALNAFLQSSDSIFNNSSNDISLAALVNLVKGFFNDTELLKNSVKIF